MTSFPGSPSLLKGGIVLIDADTGVVQRIISLQYNPDTLSRTLQVQGVGNETGDRSSSPRSLLTTCYNGRTNAQDFVTPLTVDQEGLSS